MPNLIRRERLLKKLELVTEHKLTLVCAPPGYGKTTLISQFTQQAHAESIWFSVEERERDFSAFYLDYVALLRENLPQLEVILGNSRPEPSESAAVLANALRLILKNDLILILDDIQYLGDDRRFEAWLTTFLSLLPSKCHLILLSRSLPNLPLAEMVARREVLAIGQQELRFTEDEIASFSDDSSNESDHPPPIEIINRLEGWAAGLVLAFQPLPLEVSALLAQGKSDPEALFDSLAEYMLEAQPPQLREFLLTSSLLRRITPELLTTLFGFRNPAQLIEEALRKNLFLSRASGRLSYHGLFRSFLQRQFAKTHPQRVIEIHQRAGDLFLTRGQIEDAFDHFLHAGDFERASQAADTLVQPYFEQGKVETLLRLNHDLSRHNIANDRLLYAAATIHVDRFEFDRAAEMLDQVEAMAQASNNQTRLAEVLLQRARVYLLSGHYFAAIAQAEKTLNAQYTVDNAKSRALRTLGVAHFRLGNIDEALKALEEGLSLSRAYGDKLALANLLQDLQLVYMRVGMASKAAACLQEVVAIRRTLGSSTLLTHALNDLGYHYHQQGDYLEAFASLQEGLSAIAPLQNRRVESYLLWSLGDLQRDLAVFDEAMQLYSRALEFTGNREPTLRCNILLSMSTLHRWRGEVEDAISCADEASNIAVAHQLKLEQTLAQAAYWAAQPNHLPDQLAVLAQNLTDQSAYSEAAQVWAIKAQISLANNQPRYVDNHLNAALQLLKNRGNLQPVIAEIVHAPALDAYVQANAAKFKSLSARLKHLRENLIRKSAVIHLEERTPSDYVYSLRVHTLGKEKVERDGVPILPGEWRATAARELFFYLLFLGGKRRETISLDFWPESSTERVRSNFHTTLYRVRQALGENVVVYVNDLYSIDGDVDLWCDAHEFERLVQNAQNLSLRDARTEDLFRRAVDMYQGDFLPLLNAEWIVSYRERLRETYLESLIGLGYCAEGRGDYRQGLSLFKQALKLDMFREDVHRVVMACYANLGERQKIYTHLKDMQELFRKELAIEPTKETVAWAKKLMS